MIAEYGLDARVGDLNRLVVGVVDQSAVGRDAWIAFANVQQDLLARQVAVVVDAGDLPERRLEIPVAIAEQPARCRLGVYCFTLQ